MALMPSTPAQRGREVAYRLQPANPWPALGLAAAAMALLVILPLLAAAVVPEPSPGADAEQVVLGSYDSYTELPLEFHGQPVRCPSDDLSVFMMGYDCDEVRIDSVIHPAADVDDREETLRRMVRAGSGGFTQGGGEVTSSGDRLILADLEYGIIGVLAPLDEDNVIYVQLDVWEFGEQAAAYGEAVWQTLFDEPLPTDLAGDLGWLGETPDSLSGVSPEETTV